MNYLNCKREKKINEKFPKYENFQIEK